MTLDGVAGVAFAVWAPNAMRVSVVGEFNQWDGRRHPMRKRVEAGVWEIFIPGVADGAHYKYELLGPDGRLQPLKADPVGFRHERPPETASRVAGLVRSRMARPRLDGSARGRPGARRADLDLRGPSRLVAKEERRRVPDL